MLISREARAVYINDLEFKLTEASVAPLSARFTVASFGRYFLHDVVHHLHDIDA